MIWTGKQNATLPVKHLLTLSDMTYEVIDSTGTPLEVFDTPDAALACREKLAAETDSIEFAVLSISDTGEAIERIDQPAAAPTPAR